MKAFFNLLARGTRSLSFERRRTVLDFQHENYKRRIKLIEPRSPAQILKEAWDNVGLNMWNAIGEIEKEIAAIKGVSNKTKQ